eukprot:5092891-Prymnesium_polylepis.1
MPAAVSQPLSSIALPAEAGRARGRTLRTTWRRTVASRVPRSYWCVKRFGVLLRPKTQGTLFIHVSTSPLAARDGFQGA